MVSPSPHELQPPYLSEHSVNAWQLEDSPSEKRLRRIETKREYSLIAKCVVEFLGDFTFVFVGTSQAAQGSLINAALAHGFTIFIIVTAFGHISGGHFNPAVSWAVAGAGKMPLLHLPFYVCAQLLGGFCGALTTGAVLQKADYLSCAGGATLLAEGSDWWKGLISEAVVTFFLVHTILITAADTNSVVLAPLAIGLTLSIDIFAVGGITGASMNPARSLGPNLAFQILQGSRYPIQGPPGSANIWTYHYIYWAGPLAGSTAALVFYKLFEAREDRFVR